MRSPIKLRKTTNLRREAGGAPFSLPVGEMPRPAPQLPAGPNVPRVGLFLSEVAVREYALAGAVLMLRVRVFTVTSILAVGYAASVLGHVQQRRTRPIKRPEAALMDTSAAAPEGLRKNSRPPLRDVPTARGLRSRSTSVNDTTDPLREKRA